MGDAENTRQENATQ